MNEKDMIRVDDAEVKKIMLQILLDFDRFCKDNNLTYFMDAGTLLGAVRHHGFIPWDNDIDVCMLRPDYDRMIALLKERGYYLNDHLVLELPGDTLFTFAKLGDTRTLLIEYPDTLRTRCRAYIDIFPKDGIEKKSASTRHLCNKSERYVLKNWIARYSIPYWRIGPSRLKRIAAALLAPFFKDKNAAIRRQERMIRRYIARHPLPTCEFVTTLVIGEYDLLAPRSCFEGTVDLEFEGHLIPAPVGYEEWLSIKFGKDYMTPPPPEKRRVHAFECYTEGDLTEHE